MEANQVLELLQFIKGAYARFEINEFTAKTWYHFLKGEKREEVRERVENHIRKSKYEPTLSDLVGSGLPSLEEIRAEEDRRKEERQLALRREVFGDVIDSVEQRKG